MEFLKEHLDVIIGVVLTYLLTAIGYGWKERRARKKEKRDRDRNYLDEFNEAITDYEIFYKNNIEKIVFTDLADFDNLDHDMQFAEANSILKRIIVLRTKASIIKNIPFETYNLIPRTSILSAKINHDSDGFELYNKAVRTIDDQLQELRSQLKEAYKKLD